MKSKTKRTLLLVVGTGLVLSIAACAGKFHHRDPEQRAAWFVEKVTDELELNNTQQASFKTFVDEMVNSRKVMKAQRMETRQTVMELLSQPKLDRDKSLSLVQGHIKTMQTQAPKLVNAFADFYDGLSPEQRKELREELDERFGDRGHRHCHW